MEKKKKITEDISVIRACRNFDWLTLCHLIKFCEVLSLCDGDTSAGQPGGCHFVLLLSIAAGALCARSLCPRTCCDSPGDGTHQLCSQVALSQEDLTQISPISIHAGPTDPPFTRAVGFPAGFGWVHTMLAGGMRDKAGSGPEGQAVRTVGAYGGSGQERKTKPHCPEQDLRPILMAE